MQYKRSGYVIISSTDLLARACTARTDGMPFLLVRIYIYIYIYREREIIHTFVTIRSISSIIIIISSISISMISIIISIIHAYVIHVLYM